MKTQLVMLTAVTLTCHGLNAQEGHRFYVKADAGYATSINNRTLMQKWDQEASGSTLSAVTGTYGQGVKASLGVGYMLGAHFGVELGAIYSKGATIEVDETVNVVAPGYQMGSQVTKLNNNTGLVYLQAKMALDPIGKWTPYGRLGVAMNVYAKSYDELTLSVPAYNEVSAAKTKTDYRLGLGVNATMGCNYRLNERLSLYGEVSTLLMSLSRKKDVVTAYTVNGADKLSTLQTVDRETVYDKDMHTPYPLNVNNPKPALSQFDPLSYIGISLGIQVAI